MEKSNAKFEDTSSLLVNTILDIQSKLAKLVGEDMPDNKPKLAKGKGKLHSGNGLTKSTSNVTLEESTIKPITLPTVHKKNADGKSIQITTNFILSTMPTITSTQTPRQ